MSRRCELTGKGPMTGNKCQPRQKQNSSSFSAQPERRYPAVGNFGSWRQAAYLGSCSAFG